MTEAYEAGFRKAAEDRGVDPEVLLKEARAWVLPMMGMSGIGKFVGGKATSIASRLGQLLLGGDRAKLAPLARARLLTKGRDLMRGEHGAMKRVLKGRKRIGKNLYNWSHTKLSPDQLNGWSNRHLDELNAAAKEWWKARATQGAALAGTGGLYALSGDSEPQEQNDSPFAGLIGGLGV